MRRTAQQLLGMAAMAFGLLLIARTFLLMGVVTPIRVDGSSMAATLPGASASMTCPHCKSSWQVGIDQWPAPGDIARCTRCEHRFAIQLDDVKGKEVAPGRQIWINRARADLLKRWDVVVFRCPQAANSFCIKRVIALPGESIELRDGDVWIDGCRVVKNLTTQESLRQHVHTETVDLQYWNASRDWRFDDSKWQCDPDVESAELVFSPPLGHITDDLANNQTLRHRTAIVTDLMIEADVRLPVGGELELKFAGTSIAVPPFAKSGLATRSWFDKRLLMAIDGKVAWQQELPEGWSPGEISLVYRGGNATEGAAVSIDELSIHRDIHYTWRATDRRVKADWRVPAGCYFVIGDNVAISDDSRSWVHSAALPSRLILGRVIGN